MKITIIGGGIIGLCSAYYLNAADHKVTIIERSNGKDSCSFGNAGMIVPSHFIPLATPGMIAQGIRWMFNSESPFFVRPRLDWDLMVWGLRFYQAASEKRVKAAMPALRDISLLSRSLYNDIAKLPNMKFHFEEKGLMMLCKNQATFEEEAHVAEQANGLGITAKVLSQQQLHEFEPEVKPEVAGAVFYPGDAHLYPNIFLNELKQYLVSKEVTFFYDAEVIGFTTEKDKIKEVSLTHSIPDCPTALATDEVIIAAGSWSPQLAKMLNIGLPMQGGKGYSVTYEQYAGKRLNIPSILAEARVAITPMDENKIRFGGTMEIAGLNTDINMNRVRGIIKSVPQFFPDYPIEMPKKEQVWSGLRPCSPDGLPYIGRTQIYKNLIIASGHAMMGLSLAPATGKLVQEIIDNQPLSVDINLYKPERYS